MNGVAVIFADFWALVIAGLVLWPWPVGIALGVLLLVTFTVYPLIKRWLRGLS